MAQTNGTQRRPSGEEGFTLVEALIAIVILVFGLMAIANLYAIAGSSNSVANHGTAAVALATEQMETLKSMNFDSLTPGGDLETNSSGWSRPGVEVEGVGTFDIRWHIGSVTGDSQVKYIVVRAESRGATTGRRSRTELTTFRACTRLDKPGICP